MDKEMIFLYNALFFGLAAIILIPKEYYQKYLVYGLLFGAVPDVLLIWIIGGIFHGLEYRHMGAFNIFNLFSFWTPLAWMFTFMFFLYCLPIRKLFFYLYVFTFGLFGSMVGIVLKNFGLFENIGIYNYFSPLVIIGWFLAAALTYMKMERIPLK
jgi:hypothetical protein